MKEDINYYYAILISNIARVEENKNDKKALEDITYAWNNIYEYIKLFLIGKKERYYGYILMNMRMEIAYDTKHIAAVSIDTNPFTMIVNPLLIGTYSTKEIIFIICHEIEHLVLDHPAEGLKINQMNDKNTHFLLNLAMDASINDRLAMEVKNPKLKMMKAPKDNVTSESLRRIFEINFKEQESFLYYYDYIKDYKLIREPDPNGEYDIENFKDKKKLIFHNGRAIGGIVTKKDLEEKYVISIWSDDDSPENAHEKVKEFIKQVLDGIEDEDKELWPDYQKEVIRKLLEAPKINWGSVLKKYIGMIPNSYKKTKMRINRRQPLRYDIPGRMDNRTVRIVVAIDTSGSMTSHQLQQIFAEIFSILKNTKFELTVIECDCEVRKVYTAKNIKEVNFEVSGRGMTSFIPVIDYVNSDKKYRDCVLIYFTDGYADDFIPRPLTYRNLWVLVNSNFLSVEEPYGEVLEIDMDK